MGDVAFILRHGVPPRPAGSLAVHQIIYIIGLIVVIMVILTFLGLR